MTARLAAAATALAVAATGCGEQPAEHVPSPKATVVVTSDAYLPDRVRIPVGGRVTFVNRDDRLNTAETGGVSTWELDRAKLDREERFDTHLIRQGEAQSVEFDTPGRYDFETSLGDFTGVVVVTEREAD